MEGSSKFGGEVRKIHVVYFLSHGGGNIEQPHLIRVHHLHRVGVRLRDVKRWLCDVRGKDMPDSYSWSYKRRYKSGYVWQDLKDDDLITAFSDNEYVLKGSEISLKTDIDQVPKTPRKSLRIEAGEGISPKTPSLPDHHPPVSDVSDESVPRGVTVEKIDLWKQIQEQNKKYMETEERKALQSRGWPGKKKTSSLLRNLLSCGAVDTNNSTVQRKPSDLDNSITANNSFSSSFRKSTSTKKTGNKVI